MNINNNDTAVVVIDPQNDVLSETGVSLDLDGKNSYVNVSCYAPYLILGN